MPTENEQKILIKSSCEKQISALSSEKFRISQGYLIATRGTTVRVRKSVRKSDGDEKYYFTLKVNTAGRCIEIEKKMNRRDFEDLWEIALNKLEKVRHHLPEGNATWEIDFFKDFRSKTYMAVAEIEMPEGQLNPDKIPDIIKKNTIYEVPMTDTRFANKLLSDVRYAKKLLKCVSV